MWDSKKELRHNIISGIAHHILPVLVWFWKREAIYYLPLRRELHQARTKLTLILALRGRLSAGFGFLATDLDK